MMKKFFLGILCAGGIALAAADPFFNTAVKHVDTGGEMLMYQNLTTMMFVLNQRLPEILVQLATADESRTPDPALVKQCVAVGFNMLDLMSFKAGAASSSEVAPRRFVYKSFGVVAPDSRSILIDRTVANRPLNILALPADTRLALSVVIGPGTVWKRLKAEVAAAASPELSDLLSGVDGLKEQGIDPDALLDALNGELFILVTGDSMENAGLRIDLPDHNGAVSAKLKEFLPPEEGTNTAVVQLPLPTGTPRVVYTPGKVQFVSDMKMLAPPEKTLAQRPVYAKYVKYLPASGTDYMVVDIPKSVTDLLNAVIEAQAGDTVPLRLKPLFFVAVQNKTPEGFAGTAVSNFSLFRLQSTLPLVQMGMMLPALRKAKAKAGVVKGTHEMKLVGVALAVYADAHGGVLPPQNGKAGLQALKDLVPDEDILDGKIFIGGGIKVGAERAPDRFPVAFDAPGRGTDRVNVLFLDGHVKVVEVENYTDAEQVIGALNKEGGRSPEQLKDLLRRVGENK